MTHRNLISMLAGVIVAATGAEAYPFAWEPAIQSPNPVFDVTSSYAVENLSFVCQGLEGAAMTEVMPVWIDEDGHEILARSGSHDPEGWNPEEFSYRFDITDFRGNGEYTLVFPEGLILNGAGEKSDRLEFAYSFDIDELNPPMFDDFTITSITPDFSEPQGVWSNQRVTVSTNHNDAIGLTTLQIVDLSTGESVLVSSNFSANRNVGYSSPVAWDVVGTYKFIIGREYRADFVFYNGRDQYGPTGEPTPVVDRVSYTFTGKVEGYQYSSVVLESVTPVPGNSLISNPADAVFTYVFSGPVTLYKADTPLGSAGINVYPSSCISSNEDKTVWTLDLSADRFMLAQSSTVVINAYVRDADGLQLQGNEGSEGNSTFQYEWECELGAVPLTVKNPAQGAKIDSLTEVTVGASGGQSISWSWMGSATIRSLDAGELGRLYYDGPTDAAASVSFTQWIPSGESKPRQLDITQDGDYAVTFSHGCFFSGEESSSKQTRSVTSTFRIGSGGSQPSYADFQVLSVSPGLSQAQGEWTDMTFTINTNHNEAVGLVTLTLTDATAGERVLSASNYSTGREPGESTEITLTVAGSYQFLKGHRYNAEFAFYNGKGQPGGSPGDAPQLGKASYQFNGSVQDQTYSSVSLVSVEPTPESFEIKSPEQAVFSFSFSGPVEVKTVLMTLGTASPVDVSSRLKSNADQTLWTVDLSADADVKDFEGLLGLSLYVRDTDGLPVEGNSGQYDSSRFHYEWSCMLGRTYSDITLLKVTPAPGVDVISEATQAVLAYTFSGPVSVYRAVTPLGDGGELEYPAACLSSSEDQTVWTLDLSAEQYVMGLDGTLSVCIYACDLEGYPVQGNSGEGAASCLAYEWECTVGAIPEAEASMAYEGVDPESGSVVKSLQRVCLSFRAPVVLLRREAEVYKDGDGDPVDVADLSVDPEDECVVIAALSAAIETDGVFTVIFPEAAIVDAAYFNSDGATGSFSPAFSLVYTVEPEVGAVGAVGAEACGDVFDLHGRRVARIEEASGFERLPKGIYVINGRKLVIK